jgi:hypothetical protein
MVKGVQFAYAPVAELPSVDTVVSPASVVPVGSPLVPSVVVEGVVVVESPEPVVVVVSSEDVVPGESPDDDDPGNPEDPSVLPALLSRAGSDPPHAAPKTMTSRPADTFTIEHPPVPRPGRLVTAHASWFRLEPKHVANPVGGLPSPEGRHRTVTTRLAL